jgi:UDP-N-acetylmuramoylalanine--D-glutamate ligase
MVDWRQRTITVLGLSRSGAAVARFVARRGGSVFLSDTAPATPANEVLRQELAALDVEIEMGGHGQRCFTHADLVVVSPGIPPSSQMMEQLQLSGKTIVSEVEFAACQASELPIIGITGTNGKSTTTTLISHILSEAGLRAPACGNIGIPITDILNASPPGEAYDCDVLVAELSSFQITFSPTLKPKVAILTNFKADHLDWHGSLEGYREAKLSLFTDERAPDWSILSADDPVGLIAAERTPYEVLWFSRHEKSVARYPHKIFLDEAGDFILSAKGQNRIPLFNRRDLFILGAHNEENVLAAIAAAWLMGVTPDRIAASCKAFRGLEHRLEQLPPVGPYRVLFFNDSKATNTDAAISALKAFEGRPLILIAGGYDKMTPLEEFAEEVQKAARHVILIGAAKDRFAAAFRAVGMEAIHTAPSLAGAASLGLTLSQGEPVLFSPACSSFDQFRNFEERGQVFKKAVAALAQADLSFAAPDTHGGEA